MTTEKLIEEIHARRPWYQRITFPAYGVTTTDNLDDAFIDEAPDNRLDGLSAQEASRMRPIPKWKYIQQYLPDVRGLDVLEIGCNNGFFSFKFAELGAKSVVGLDVNNIWLEKAKWCNNILGHKQVSFHFHDFMIFNDINTSPNGFLSNRDTSIPIPHDSFDMIFSSTVINHMFFPFFAIYKMLAMSRKWVVIDFPVLKECPEDQSYLKMDLQKDAVVHAFIFNKKLLELLLIRLGIPSDDIVLNTYNNGNAVTAVVNTTNMKRALEGA